MINDELNNISYEWLILTCVISMLAFFNAGFDHDVVFYCVLLMSIWIMIDVLFKMSKIEWNEIMISYTLFTFWAGSSIIWSISPVRTMVELIHLIGYGLIYIIIRKLTLEDIQKLFKVLLVVTSVLATLGLLEFVFISTNRIQMTFTNPNPFGIFMVMMFMVAVSSSIRNISKVSMLVCVLLLSVVVLSGSRASIGALLISISVIFLGLNRSQIKQAIFKVIFIFVITLIFAQIIIYIALVVQEHIIVNNLLIESITRSNNFVTSSLKGRLEFWRVAFELFTNKPIIGYGQGSFHSSYYLEYGLNEWYSRFTHNHYLQIASELGGIGLILFLSFIWTSFISVLFNSKQKDKPNFYWGLIAGLIAFLLHIGVDFTWNFPVVTALFFLFLGVVTRFNEKKSFFISRKVSGIVICMIVLLTFWQLGSTKFYMKAINLEQTDSAESALTLTKVVNKVYPISTFGWSYESDLYNKKYQQSGLLEDFNSAIYAAKKAISVTPFDSGVNVKLAKLYQSIGNYPKAEKYFIDATNCSAYQLNSFTELINLYSITGERNKEIVTLESALVRAPYAIQMSYGGEKDVLIDTVANMHLTLVKLYTEKGDKIKANEQAVQFLNLKGEYPQLEKYMK